MNSGIYKITNLQNNKCYIGSTKDFEKRRWTHFSRLKNNNHTNKHLQSAYNKYGADNFKFEIVEYVEEELLLNIEQSYIDDSEKEDIYNKTYIAGAGGYDTLSIPVYLLDLKGNILEEASSISEISRIIKRRINSININTKQIIFRKYRVVSIEFYNSNIEEIKSWRAYPNQTIENGKNYILRQIVIYNGKEYSSKKELEKELPITLERIRQIIVGGNNKKFDIKYKHPELQNN